MKVEKYNGMLEDVYQCEVKLTNITPTLLDMRDQIAEEARILAGSFLVQRSRSIKLCINTGRSDRSINLSLTVLTCGVDRKCGLGVLSAFNDQIADVAAVEFDSQLGLQPAWITAFHRSPHSSSVLTHHINTAICPSSAMSIYSSIGSPAYLPHLSLRTGSPH